LGNWRPGTQWTPWDNGLATNGEDWGNCSGTDFAMLTANGGNLDIGATTFGCCGRVFNI